MDKIQTIQRAKSYMDMLSNSIDPITGELIANDSVLGQERLQKCFMFVSEILDEVIKTNGIVSLPATKTSQGYTVVKKKSAFSIDLQQRNNIKISDKPILPATFIKNVNSVIDADSMEKLSITSINKWLLKQGYVAEQKIPTVINRNIKTITPLSSEIGIVEETIVDKKTGEAKLQIMFSRQTQEFILNNIESVTE